MKNRSIICLILTMVLTTTISCRQQIVKNVAIKSQIDSVSYAAGLLSASSALNDSIFLDPLSFAKGMYDLYHGQNKMSGMYAQMIISQYTVKLQAQKEQQQRILNEKRYAEYAAQNRAFLEENRNKEGIVTTSSGLQYKIDKLGNGPKPSLSDILIVNYTLSTIDGTVINSTEASGAGEISLSNAIDGFIEAAQLMPIGSQFTLYVPYELGYGADGVEDIILPYSTLIFNIELIGIQ